MVRSRALLFLILLSACTRSHDTEAGFAVESIKGDEDGEDEMPATCAEQMEESLDGLPVDLACTGLYSDFEKQKIGKGVEGYVPAYKLWSDNSDKSRWIKLPKGEKIDTSNMRSWSFPIGTKVWKEFRANGNRAETRLFMKVRDDLWRKTTYAWSKDQKTATRLDTGNTRIVNGVNYEIPKAGACNDCHDGAHDSVLGFEVVSLGLPSADQSLLTLQKLVDMDWLSDPPEHTTLTIGDDGTGKAADALGWIHINCGVTCHNAGVNSEAETTGLRMKLDPAELDGRPSNDFEVLKLLVDVDAKTNQWVGKKRIVPGNADESLLYQLITTRIGVDSNKQMPPLLTRIVDDEHANKIKDWINSMKPTEAPSPTEGPQ